MYEEVIRALDDSESKIIVSYGCKNFRFYDKPFIKKCLQEAFRENIEVEVVEHLKARSREIVWNPYWGFPSKRIEVIRLIQSEPDISKLVSQFITEINRHCPNETKHTTDQLLNKYEHDGLKFDLLKIGNQVNLITELH